MSNNKGKAVVFLVILIIIALGLGCGAYYLLQQEKTRNVDLTQQLDDAKAQQSATKSELEDAKNKIARLQSNLSDAQIKVTDLSSSLEKEKSSKNISLKEIEKLKSDLNTEISVKIGIQKELDDSVETLKSMGSRFKEMEAKINELESKKKDLEEKVKGLEEKAQNVELGKIVVNPEQGAAAGKASSAMKLEGKIAVVNKDYNFAVINLGSKDGVTIGSIFSVTHNNRDAGDLKVEKVHDSMSAAGFVSADMKDKIAEGDKVKLKK